MNDCTLTVNTDHFRAVALFMPAASDKLRPALEGVHLEASPSQTRCVATDGRALGVTRAYATNNVTELRAVTIPRAVVAILVKMLKPGGQFTVQYEGGKWRAETPTSALGFTPVDCDYPDYRKVIPQVITGETGQFDVLRLARFEEVRKALGLKTLPQIEHNGDRGARVVFNDYAFFVGVVMPLRPAPHDVATAWASEPISF